MVNLTRRRFIRLTGGVTAVGLTSSLVGSGIAAPNVASGAKQKVVVVGAGYAGAVTAKYLRMANPNIQVTLIEKDPSYYSGPLSNWVIAGFRDIAMQKWEYDGLKKHGINVVIDEAVGIDPIARSVTTKGGNNFKYDRLVVAPGIDFKDVEGLDADAQAKITHAWKAGPETVLLANQLASMRDGDTFILVVPPDPYRCPPGPYERASLVAHYMKKHKPKSKVLVLDSKPKFSKQGLFEGGWSQLYGYGTDKSIIQWVSSAEGGKVVRVDAKEMTVYTDNNGFEESHVGGCINIIPPQRAGNIAKIAGLTNESGWCPVNLKTFESKLHKGVFVIGDSSMSGGMPKSGYAANSQAKVVAEAIVAQLKGQEPGEPSYVNTCYSMISPDYGISVAAVWKYDPANPDKVKEITSGVSPGKASLEVRKQEALYNESWYRSIMSDTFG